MRVLFAVNPEKSIFQYLVPMAWALRTAGHEVQVASQPGFAPVITQAGLTAVPVGRDSDPWRLVETDPALYETLHKGIPAPYDVVEAPEKATWEYLRDGYAHHVRWWHRLCNVPIIDGLVEYARWWRPDLVIWEPLTYAGPIAAKACGAAHARLLFGIDVFGITRHHYLNLKNQQPPHNRTDPLAEWLTTYTTKYNTHFTEDMTTGHFTINQFPPSLQTQAPHLHYLHTQYTPYGGPATIPPWLHQPPTKPRITLTMGLSATTRFNGYPLNLQNILNSLADLDIELIATIPETQQHQLTIPPNTRTTPYVPLHALAPTSTAVIHHAGAATLTTTSLHAIPQIAIHHHYDQPILAHKLATQGTAIAIPATQATGPAIRNALHQILTNPTYKHHATQLQNEIHTLPTPNTITTHIEQLTTKHKTH